ncbi:MAG: DUF5107 domain-containing protein [Lachnospiraceae bacterium]|nr:DUF5107 domain-containing protein [Lachnospiraceae bacterium]
MSEVKVWEEDVIIPTYEIGEADKNPMFLEKRVYQGSSGKVYPYPTIEKISREKKDKTWRVVYLENEYLKVMVMPQLGGRIQRALDKTNNYDFIYYNQSIKPALVGLLGPWISGGIEFNWPQHHRPTTYMPVDYVLKEHPDGSRSVVCHDVDQMYGTKAIQSFTLYPGKAYIEIKGQLYNRTNLPQTFLWWANPAVSVNDDTQSVFPPDVHFVMDHGKRDVSRFPIAKGVYYKHDYSEGVDISRYKNIPVPTSYMAEHSDYNFVGGYDYGKEAGLLHVADHHYSPGKKQWTWGNGDFGKAWDRNLTDADGPYIELMTGVYTENQPDFSWLKPFEEKTFRQYFMPYKKAGYVKNATIRAALNSELKEDGLHVTVYATSQTENARVSVWENGKRIHEETVTLSPTDILERVYPTGTKDETALLVRVFDEAGEELVAYQAKEQEIPKQALPGEAAKDPAELRTNEELLLTAQHIEQHRHATYLPDPYYLEGLKRDPLDMRINNAYGMLLLRRGLFKEAEGYFRNAVKRATWRSPNPYNSECYYDLGLALFYEERFDEAYDAFYKACWSNEQQEMAYYYLACIALRRGEYEEALLLCEKGLYKNWHNIKARGLKASILRLLGRKEEAEALIRENLSIDHFDYLSRFELYTLTEDNEVLMELKKLSRDFHEHFLMIARDYAESGQFEQAIAVLSACGSRAPMMLYYRAYYLHCLRRDNDAVKAFAEAEQADPARCFPNKLEDIPVLEVAISLNPEGAKAFYYLGNLYYDKLQFEKAASLWEKSVSLDGAFPTVHRNLALYYYNKKHAPEEAKKALEKAFFLDETDARVFLELDQLYKKLSVPFAERLRNYEAHMDIIRERDDVMLELVTLYNLSGSYEKAYDTIMSCHFRPWEGAEGRISGQYKISLLEQAKKKLLSGDDAAAEELLEKALEYPENLGEGRLEGTKDNHIHYYLGIVREHAGDREGALREYRLATLGQDEPAGMLYYYDQPADMILYKGFAHRKLWELSGGTDAEEKRKAHACFNKLMDYGERHIRDEVKNDYFAVSLPDFLIFDDDMNCKNEAHCHYLMGLAHLGLFEKEEAAKELRKVIGLDYNHQNARIYLSYAENEML